MLIICRLLLPVQISKQAQVVVQGQALQVVLVQFDRKTLKFSLRYKSGTKFCLEYRQKWLNYK